MNKINFKNLPDTTTPLSAENLNLLQDNVEDAIDDASVILDSTVNTSSTNGVENQAITNYVNDIADTIPTVKTTTTSSNTNTYSCNYINGKLGWTLIDEKTGSASVSLPETFNELLCVVSVAGSPNVCFSIVIPYIDLSSSNKGYNAGYFGNADSISSQVRVIATTTSAYLTTAILNKADSLSTSTTRYYYR